MAQLIIEYCHECMFLGRAIEVAQKALHHYPDALESVTLIPGSNGVFTVMLDHLPIYTINEEGLLPSSDQVQNLLAKKLGAKLA
ncbi:SelT/SelW/SelH family protein [Candidatus Acetothermia bacterium]|nr:SelT/SelW/SelH family protein [Candidatus Acetothermia bacterium]MBI3643272.1 SelT/SelW/SelH family protein [Candidatus Acetothermia bacterium]